MEKECRGQGRTKKLSPISQCHAGPLGALSHVGVRQGAVKNVAATILAGMLRAGLGPVGE
jgi:hypothetical protein